jgi:hypothetical protein
MTLTNEQVQAIKEGIAVAAFPPEVGEQCVVVRSDVYQRVRHLVEDIDPADAYPAIDEAWKEGWEPTRERHVSAFSASCTPYLPTTLRHRLAEIQLTSPALLCLLRRHPA